MAEILFHHYPLSPFSEKVRRLLAYKQLPWRAVEQPIMAPKPELTPLTGGYRRIPVLQIGADIYCDTALILRVLEQRHPTPACLPAPLAGAVSLLEDWADHRLFMQTVPPTIVRLLDQDELELKDLSQRAQTAVAHHRRNRRNRKHQVMHAAGDGLAEGVRYHFERHMYRTDPRRLVKNLTGDMRQRTDTQ